jgi:competence protein ComEC
MILIVGTACAIAVWVPLSVSSEVKSQYLQVHFLDVGQGDAAFIETPSGVQVLIDGGKDGSVLQELAKVMDFSDKTIDMVVGTHPDKDHIGGLVDVLEQYEVGMILTTENKGETATAEMYNSLKEAEGATIVNARRGQEFALDASTTLRVIFPDSDPAEMETNTSSIVLQLIYGGSEFLFMGDSPKNIEEYLTLIEGEHLQSDVLKVGHHGSRTSTSELFLDEVEPQFAVISAGKENSYGHPHVEVTDMLFNFRVEMLETSLEGTITFLSDGIQLWKQ